MPVARACRLPLITIAHHWYPYSSCCPRWGIWVCDHGFHRLFRQSAVDLAVSEAMASAIGPHQNLYVLPPIADPSV